MNFIRLLTFFFFFCNISNSQTSGVGIGTRDPDQSAMLDITNSNKGILIPRVFLQSSTDISTIPNSAESLLVYNNNPNMIDGKGSGFYYWSGSISINPNKWIQLAPNIPSLTNNEWHLSGNRGTTAGTDFVGTTDVTDLQIKTNNLPRITVASAGNVSIGNTIPDPSAILDINVANKAIRIPNAPLISFNDITTIPDPKAGMVVFNTTQNQLCYFDGTNWVQTVTTVPNVVSPKLYAVVKSTNINTTFTTGNVFYDTKVYDPENSFTLGTSTALPAQYKVAKKGLHQIFVNYSLKNVPGVGSSWYIRIKKNGVVIAASDATTSSAGGSACVFCIDEFVAGDIITIDKGGAGSGWEGGGLSKLTIFRFE